MEALAKFSIVPNTSITGSDQKTRLEKLKEDLRNKGWKKMAVSIDKTAQISPVLSVGKQEGLQKTERFKKNIQKTTIPFAKDRLALYILENLSQCRFKAVLEEVWQLEDSGLIDFGLLILPDPELLKAQEKPLQEYIENFDFSSLNETDFMTSGNPSLVIFQLKYQT